MQKILSIVAALGLALPAASISAQPNQNSVAVEYRDLNLASPRGRERLSRRIDSAARKLCGYHTRGATSVVDNADARRCYRQAKVSAFTRYAAVAEQRAKGG